MKKILIVSLCGIFASTFANAKSANTPSLVGNWLCEAVVYQDNMATQTKNRVSYQLNNQATETIQVNHYDKGELRATGNLRLSYQWDLVGGRQKFSNMNISSYDLYDHVTKQSASFGEIALLKQSLLDYYQNDPWQTIVFIDKDTHQYISDDGATGMCVRETAQS